MNNRPGRDRKEAVATSNRIESLADDRPRMMISQTTYEHGMFYGDASAALTFCIAASISPNRSTSSFEVAMLRAL